MKKLIIGLSLILSTQSFAQELPQLSPKGEVEQTVGLTAIEIEYSRPSMRGREIFGDLLPYGEVWRTGANGRATIKFEDPVQINGKFVEAGKYAILTVPNEKHWLFVLNTDTKSWGANNYSGEQNVLELKLPLEEVCEPTETFTMGFENFEDSSANLFLKWEKAKISVRVTAFVNEKAWKNINIALKENPEDAKVLRNAAKYAAQSGQNLDRAEEWITRSIEIEESWFSYVVKARVFAANGEVEEAKGIMKEAIGMGRKSAKENEEEFRYEKGLVKEMESWE